MAEVQKTADPSSLTKLAPWQKTLDTKFRKLDRVDVAAIEKQSGVLLEGKLLAQLYGWDNLVYCAWLAQRDRLKDAGRDQSMEEMLGKPGGRNMLRAVMRAHYHATRTETECVMHVRVPPESKTLPLFAQWLTAAVAKVIFEETGQKKTPKYAAVGIGQTTESEDNHSKEVMTALKQRMTAATGSTST